jgi:hypothetical protein
MRLGRIVGADGAEGRLVDALSSLGADPRICMVKPDQPEVISAINVRVPTKGQATYI